MQDRSFESFEKLPIARMVMRNALPAMAAMIMVLVYNLADTFFIGKTGDALLVAAVSLATPVFLLFMAAGTVFGIGGTSVISRALGEGRRDYARKVCSFCMWGSVLLGVLLSAFIIFFMEEILVFIGTSAATRESAGTYLLIVSLAGPLVLISTCFSNVVRAEGEATRSVLGQIMGNLINIVLDPILILGFGWGISGAAIATVIGYLASAIYYIFYYLGGKSSLGIGIRDFSIGERIPGNVFSIGIPAALGSVLMSLSQIIVNSRMSLYGDMAVAGMGVAMKVVIITGMICMGMGQGVQPVLGYSVGAGLWERFNKLLRFSLLLALVLGLVMTLFCYLFVEDIVSAFLTD